MSPSSSVENPSSETSPNLLKRLFKGLAIFILLIILVLGAVVTFVDVNTFRKPISTALSDASGLDVRFSGLHLDWARGLGLRADEVSVLTKNGKRTLFSSEALFLRVKWRPLLNRKVEVEEVVLQKPVLRIQREQVVSVPPEAPVASPSSPAPLTTHQVGLKPIERLLMGLHLNAESVRLEEALVLWPDLSTSSGAPVEARVSMTLNVRRPEEKQLDINVEALDLSVGPVSLTGRIQATDVLRPTASLETKLAGKPLELEELSQFLPLLPKKVRKVWNQFDPVGEVESWAVVAQGAELNLFDESWIQGKNFQVISDFALKNLVLQPPPDRPELRLGFSTVTGNLRWKNAALHHDIQTETRGIPVSAKGQIKFPQTGPDRSAYVETILGVSAMQATVFNEWLPSPWKIDGGTLSHQVQVQGALPNKLSIKGAVEGQEGRMSYENDPSLKIPIQSLAGNWRLENGRIRLTSLNLIPPHGKIQAKAQYGFKERSYKLEFAGRGLRIEDFYLQNVDGALAAEGTLQGTVLRRGSVLRQVSGKVRAKASAGRFYQLEPLRALLTALNPLSVAQLNEKGLRYDALGGNFDIEHGKATTRDFSLTTPEMRIFLDGMADPTLNQIDMRGKFLPSQTLDKTIKAVPILGDILTGGKKGRLIETRFTLTGPLKRPKIKIDPGNTLKEKGNDILKELGRQLFR